MANINVAQIKTAKTLKVRISVYAKKDSKGVHKEVIVLISMNVLVGSTTVIKAQNASIQLAHSFVNVRVAFTNQTVNALTLMSARNKISVMKMQLV